MTEAGDHPRANGREDLEIGSVTIDPARVATLYEAHGPELRRFVLGLTRDPEVTGDVVQATFVKAVELGHTARSETFKGWLFRVAYHEALTARRRRETREEGHRRLAGLGLRTGERPDEGLCRVETIAAVREALRRLPENQRRVVQARFYEGKTFAEIAEGAGLPLGTVLTRMRLALEKLRRSLRPGD